ncbi:hypothetical protein NB496_10945, partial [Vibrio alginolyticus]|uniref:hypothetical protein n=1 Tax=Vibrio alginolyticus TaxID=663 RepID=UPI00215BED3D
DGAAFGLKPTSSVKAITLQSSQGVAALAHSSRLVHFSIAEQGWRFKARIRPLEPLTGFPLKHGFVA